MLQQILSLLAMATLLMGQTKPEARPNPHTLYKAGFDARVAGHYDDAIRPLPAAIGTGELNDDDLALSYNNRGMAYAATARGG